MKIHLKKLKLFVLFCIAVNSSLFAQNYNETYRGQFHFSSQRGWLNDPNGLIYYHGEYHLFYQYNPYGNVSGNKHWGHAVSTDLVHWKQLDIALYQDEFGMMYSGTAVIDKNNTSGLAINGVAPMILFYTAAGTVRTQNMAYSYDGRTFTKYPTPLVQQVVPGNRDPRVIWYEPTQKWVMVFYGEKDETHTIFFYTSSNLKDWAYASEFKGGPKTSKYLYECPDFYEMPVEGDISTKKWILSGADGQYAIGSFDGTTFTPEAEELQGTGGSNSYAGQTFNEDPQGRKIEIAWWKTNTLAVGMPFNQSMSIPMEIKLVNTTDGLRLTRTPVAELNQLRINTYNYDNTVLESGQPNPLSTLNLELAELRAKFKPGTSGIATFNIRGVPIVYNATNQQITVNNNITMSAPLNNGEMDLAIYVDRIGIEVFANGGLQYIPLNKNLDPANKSYSLAVTGVAVTFDELKVYELKSAWIVPEPTEISYASPHEYTVSTEITPLNPVKSGGDILPSVIVGRTMTIAGNGTSGYVNGPKASARFNAPIDLDFDKDGNMYITEDGANCIRKISSSGDVSLFAGSDSNQSGYVNGIGASARFTTPLGIAIHPVTGDIYVTDLNCIRKITPEGEVSTFAGINGSGSAGFVDNVAPSAAKFSYLSDIIIDKEGNIYVADRDNHRIRKYTASTNLFTTLAGSIQGYSEGMGSNAEFNTPNQLALDAAGNIYVADRNNYRIRKVTPGGVVTTVAGNGTPAVADGNGTSAGFADPLGIAIADNGNIYVSEYSKNLIRQIDTDGNVTTLTGSSVAGLVDGIGTVARLKTPFGITIGPDGNLFFAERNNHSIRTVTLSGYTISPGLPKGLKFDGLTGGITGMPSEISPQTTYTIKAYNGYGEEVATTTLELSVGNSLPVKLTAYNVIKNTNGTINITWETRSEINSCYFILSRSIDGVHFEQIHKTTSLNTAGAAYIYVDKTPYPQTNYYKLTQVDCNGTSEELGIKAVIAGFSPVNDWKVYPNPIVERTCSVYLPPALSGQSKTVDIYGIDGVLLYSETLKAANNTITVEIPVKINIGTYIMEVKGLGAKRIIIK